ncbi:MAG: pepsin/retropepsin-like aspartic protease family protein [Rhizomicrobium sp.]|nr:pepsin/retropepsin-like aspartic protease family protein [Rhizomicrobium sp.]
MQQQYSRHFSLSLVIAAITITLCLEASAVFGAPIDLGEHSATGDASVAKPALSRHAHTLPTKFHNGLVYIKVSVDGHPGAWMILDSGSTESIIDTEYADAIGLKLTPSADAPETFGSMKAATFDTDKAALRVGEEKESALSFQSISLGGMMGPDGTPAVGLLGRTFLEGKVIVIDYKHEDVYFETMPQPADSRDIAMTLKTGIPIIKLKMANQLVDSLIDTGGTYGMIVTPITAKSLGIERYMADAKPADTVGHGGEQHIVVGKAPPFEIGDLAVQDVNAAYTTFGTATDTIGAGVSLGVGFLQNYRLTLNYVANTVRFEP